MSSESEVETFWELPSVVGATRDWVRRGLAEDRAQEDVAGQALFEPSAGPVRATITAGAPGVLCGGPAAVSVFRELDPHALAEFRRPEGCAVGTGETVLTVVGAARAILAGERTALNILGHLSGIASQARRYQEAAGPRLRVLDTRKTLPGLRLFQKFAVRCGGATNHRFDLAEFPMAKENHRDLFRARLPGALARAPAADLPGLIGRLRSAAGLRPVQVEVEDEASFLACLQAGVELVLVDNRTDAELAEWVVRAEQRLGPGVGARVEASGGITLERLPALARSGIGRVSVGALTHSAPALDLSLHVAWVESDERPCENS